MKKNLVIIGGSGLIGANLADYLSKKNFNIIIIDLKKRHEKFDFYKSDLTNTNKFTKTIDLIFKKYSKIDAVINCAYPKNKNWGKKFEFLKPADVKENLYNQLGSYILSSQVIIKKFLKQKYGNLIFFSSIQGIAAPKFDHYLGTKLASPIEYSAAKAGIINITRYLAKYYKKKNIRVNCISPGGIFDFQPKKFLKRYNLDCTSKGMLDPIDLCGTVYFLVSKNSKHINGQNIIIDDGWSL